MCIRDRVSVASWALLRPSSEDQKEVAKGSEEIDMDAAFDEPADPPVTTSPFEATPETAQRHEDPTLLEGLDDVLDELTGRKTEEEDDFELPPAPDIGQQKADLDLEDIEALFEE